VNTTVPVFGKLSLDGLEVVERDGRYFIRYDAGAHQVAWREDEISFEELAQMRSSRPGEYQIVTALQRRLQERGVDPFKQNWEPDHDAIPVASSGSSPG
jgi:hypothetical protein